MNKTNALCNKFSALSRIVCLVAAVFALASCKNESPQSTDAPKPDAKQETTESPTISRLTYINSSAPFDYQKRMLAEGGSIRQYEYVLFEAGSIPVDSQGKILFSATGPGFMMNHEGSTASTVTVEKPMNVKITGTIHRDKFALAETEGKGAAVIGHATYQHSLEGSKKATFSRGDFEMSEYTQEVERELEILYVASRGIIAVSSQGAFQVQKIGTGTTSYSGEKETSEYSSSDSMDLYLEFSVD